MRNSFDWVGSTKLHNKKAFGYVFQGNFAYLVRTLVDEAGSTVGAFEDIQAEPFS